MIVNVEEKGRIYSMCHARSTWIILLKHRALLFELFTATELPRLDSHSQMLPTAILVHGSGSLLAHPAKSGSP